MTALDERRREPGGGDAMTATLQPESKSISTSRRAVLAAAAGAAAAFAARAVLDPATLRAAGDDGLHISVGDTFLDVRTGTYLSDAFNNNTVLSAVSSSAGGNGAGIGLLGASSLGTGVLGTSDTSNGVKGASDSGTGVYGSSGSYMGIYGTSNSASVAAIVGKSTGHSSGLQGYSGTASLPVPPAKTGVFGYASQDATSVGVRGESPAGFGVYGKTTGTGFAGYFNGKTFMSQFVEIGEMSTPAAPSGNRARLFVRDNGVGKTQLCVRFPTGAVQVLATQA
jgi:hypothetical protein